MRKTLAGLLIRTAHRIYPPKVTETTREMPLSNRIFVHNPDALAAAAAVERVWRRRGMTHGR
ncbi:hypothetical protein [Nocardia asiatica]|uniref:hypothetical protein n=1 Tax=Nocardia asiatica TaxID=209252 RepID=UPI0002DAB8D7|nr:hypothetical protein [Nocardia asiatica]